MFHVVVDFLCVDSNEKKKKCSWIFACSVNRLLVDLVPMARQQLLLTRYCFRLSMPHFHLAFFPPSTKCSFLLLLMEFFPVFFFCLAHSRECPSQLATTLTWSIVSCNFFFYDWLLASSTKWESNCDFFRRIRPDIDCDRKKKGEKMFLRKCQIIDDNSLYHDMILRRRQTMFMRQTFSLHMK